MLKKSISVLLAVLILAGVSVTSFGAKSKTFYSDKTKASFSKNAVFTITSTKGGSLNFKIANTKVCSAKWGKWSGSKIKLTVTGKKSGSTKINVTNKKTKEKLTLSVTVKAVKVKSISLSKKTLTMKKGATAALKCTVKPSTATNPAVKWTSSNTKVATVSSKGKITAKKSGIVKITASTTDGSKLKATCTVTVLNKTVSTQLKNNLEYLKTYIQDAGDYNSYGEQGIFKEDENTLYSVRYLPKEKVLVFGMYDPYTEDGEDFSINVSIEMKLSLTGFDYCTADYANVYFEGDSPVSSYYADVIIGTSSYNLDGTAPTINIKSNTYNLSKSTVKNHINTDFQFAMMLWNEMLTEELGMGLNQFGFKNY